MTPDFARLAALIRDDRHQLGLSQKAYAGTLGLTQKQISDLEREAARRLSAKTADAIRTRVKIPQAPTTFAKISGTGDAPPETPEEAIMEEARHDREFVQAVRDLKTIWRARLSREHQERWSWIIGNLLTFAEVIEGAKRAHRVTTAVISGSKHRSNKRKGRQR